MSEFNDAREKTVQAPGMPRRSRAAVDASATGPYLRHVYFLTAMSAVTIKLELNSRPGECFSEIFF